jgi:hypothetical protein
MMFDSAILEVAIGLTVVYIVFSLACTAINEFIANLLRLRAIQLEKGILSLFQGDSAKVFSKDLYNHPLVKSIAEAPSMLDGLLGQPGKPSYIPANTFVTALLDLSANPPPAGGGASPNTTPLPTTTVAMRKMIDNLPAEVKSVLSPVVQTAGSDMDKARANLEAWYDTAMDRVSGQYKRVVQWVILFIALILVGCSNADTFMLANRFWKDPALRQTLVNQAQQLSISQQPKPTDATKSDAEKGATTQMQGSNSEDALKAVDKTIKPLLGWTQEELRVLESDPTSRVSKIFGLLLTAFAASLGAPFWFDVLSKVSSLRYSGEKVERADAKK